MSMMLLRDALALEETFDRLSTAYVIWLMPAPILARWALTFPIAVSNAVIASAEPVTVPTEMMTAVTVSASAPMSLIVAVMVCVLSLPAWKTKFVDVVRSD